MITERFVRPLASETTQAVFALIFRDGCAGKLSSHDPAIVTSIGFFWSKTRSKNLSGSTVELMGGTDEWI